MPMLSKTMQLPLLRMAVVTAACVFVVEKHQVVTEFLLTQHPAQSSHTGSTSCYCSAATTGCVFTSTRYRLDKRVSWRQYFNYLHRQLYVLDTYTNRHNRTINHTMMGVHSWASISFVAPIAACECTGSGAAQTPQGGQPPAQPPLPPPHNCQWTSQHRIALRLCNSPQQYRLPACPNHSSHT